MKNLGNSLVFGQNIEVTVKEESEGKWMTYAKADCSGSNMDTRLTDNFWMNRAVLCPDGRNIIRTVTFFFRRESDIYFGNSIERKQDIDIASILTLLSSQSQTGFDR